MTLIGMVHVSKCLDRNITPVVVLGSEEAFWFAQMGYRYLVSSVR